MAIFEELSSSVGHVFYASMLHYYLCKMELLFLLFQTLPRRGYCSFTIDDHFSTVSKIILTQLKYFGNK